jgi:renin receptor
MPLSLYIFVDGNYPFKFSIVLFTSVGLALVLLFITVGMWTMEPGKDTIIYRMTQTKKKDL